MKAKKDTTEPAGTCEETEKVVARAARVSFEDAEMLARELGRPHLADVLVWPHSDGDNPLPLLLAFYGDDRKQVLKRVAHAKTRFRLLGARSEVLAVRPVDMEEMRMFCLALEELEAWKHRSDAGELMALLSAPLPSAKKTRRRKPLSWVRTLKEFVNNYIRRRERVLLPEELIEEPAEDSESEGAAVSADPESGKKNAPGRRKSERSEPQAANNPMEGGDAMKP